MHWRLGLVSLGLVLATSSAAAYTVNGERVPLTEKDKTAIRRDVRASLKDPASAKFGPMAARKDDRGTIVVCGLVNAKTSAGGYAGMRYYLGMLFRREDQSVQLRVAGMTDGSEVVCRNAGLILDE